MQKEKQFSPLIIGVMSVVLIVLSIIIIVVMSNQKSSEYKDKDNFEISNLSKYTSGKPSDKETLDYIKHALYETVNKNSEENIPSGSIKDVLIRDGSFSQELESHRNIHKVTFIVDIASLRQSYFISYQWANSSNSGPLDEWGTVVTCLEEKDIIYKDFNKCTDMTKEMINASPDENISKNLPYSSDFFSVNYYMEGEETIISVQIMLNNNSERTAKAFDMYKDDAKKWMNNNNIDTSKYKITYRDISNILISTEEPSK